MKEKKGFTLTELLVVIVMIAVILITISPIAINIIEKNRKKALTSTAYGLIDSAKLIYEQEKIEDKVAEKNYTFPQSGTNQLDFKGTKPEGGTIKITESGEVGIAIHSGKWCAKKELEELDITIIKYEKDTCLLKKEMIELPEPETSTPKECFQTREHEKITYTVNKQACMNFFEQYYDNEYVTTLCTGSATQLQNHVNMNVEGFVEETGVITVLSKEIDGLEIVNYKNDCEKDVVIPETIDGKPVKAIKEHAFHNQRLTSVVLPSSIENINPYAFSSNQLKYADFSKATNLIAIGKYAFSNNQLVSLQLPPNIVTIGYSAFSDNQLTNVNFSDLAQITIIEAFTFSNNKLKNVVIPNSVTTIGYNAFSSNQLTNVTIPNTVTNIEAAAFNENQLPKEIMSRFLKM